MRSRMKISKNSWRNIPSLQKKGSFQYGIYPSSMQRHIANGPENVSPLKRSGKRRPEGPTAGNSPGGKSSRQRRPILLRREVKYWPWEALKRGPVLTVFMTWPGMSGNGQTVGSVQIKNTGSCGEGLILNQERVWPRSQRNSEASRTTSMNTLGSGASKVQNKYQEIHNEKGPIVSSCYIPSDKPSGSGNASCPGKEIRSKV